MGMFSANGKRVVRIIDVRLCSFVDYMSQHHGSMGGYSIAVASRRRLVMDVDFSILSL